MPAARNFIFNIFCADSYNSSKFELSILRNFILEVFPTIYVRNLLFLKIKMANAIIVSGIKRIDFSN